jgi:hypothetical protein
LISDLKSTLTFSSSDDQGTPGTHALTILARVMGDPVLACKAFDPKELFSFFQDTNEKSETAKVLLRYVKEWSFDPSRPSEVERKIEELQWMNALIFTAAGFDKLKGGVFRADFFLMHLVTSSLFLPSLTAILSPSSQEILLRGYLAVSLAVYVSRGRPNIDPVPLFKTAIDDTKFDVGASPPTAPNSCSLTVSSRSTNPWVTIIPQAILHFDDHLPKFERAVAHFAGLYGSNVKDISMDLGLSWMELKKLTVHYL